MVQAGNAVENDTVKTRVFLERIKPVVESNRLN